ncbi:autophagy-related protein 17 [Bombardia bombarda]|uniref:Autophagy-related protein 17 n=1 Tax=Bombardia bombarda TaxID=252184 RepID=A0AA40CAH5_9PEZI|nr:autophagy-related protein 17 [Bombardia bombarda]
MATFASPASSGSRSVSASSRDPSSAEFNPDDVPVELLVRHLLEAKRALSSITQVMQANHLTHNARQMHEESVILTAQTAFLRHNIAEQQRILRKVRRGMTHVYENGSKEFEDLIVTLDKANNKLESTLGMLRTTVVESIFRPPGEEAKYLLDFVDENSVGGMQNALKESIGELQAIQKSFDSDLLDFDTYLRKLAAAIKAAATSPPSPSGSSTITSPPIPRLLASLTNHSHDMAEHLASLTKHFDLCVLAVRDTDGGVALARRRAAEEDPSDGNPVSISGVIAAQDLKQQQSHMTLPTDPRERAEMLHVVLQDASQVNEVVSDIQRWLQEMEADFALLKEQTDSARRAYAATIMAFHVLEEVGCRLQSYVAAQAEFVQRWAGERELIEERLGEMEELGRFYEGYASAYDSLLLEVERRRSVEDRIGAIWRKAKESVEKLVEVDKKEREHFRQEIGEYLPTDLWVGMNGPVRRWVVVPVEIRMDIRDTIVVLLKLQYADEMTYS